MSEKQVSSPSIGSNGIKKITDSTVREGIPNPRTELTLRALESATNRVSASVVTTRWRALVSLICTIALGVGGVVIIGLTSPSRMSYVLLAALLAGAMGTTIGLFSSVPRMRIERMRLENLQDVVRHNARIPRQATSEEDFTQGWHASRNDDARD
jgi:hypothetical protein